MTGERAAGGEIRLIAALDRQRAIGRGNALPWHLPDDLRRFKALTRGNPVLMGRKTAESLGRALPNRRNLVLTRSGRVPFAGMEAVPSLAAALATSRGLAADAGDLWVIGGGEIFAMTLPIATGLHLTWVDTVVADADAFFPPIDASQWQITARASHGADHAHAFAFEFVDYEPVRPPAR